MTENLPPPSTQTATPNQSLSPLNQPQTPSFSNASSSAPTAPQVSSATAAPTDGIVAAGILASPTNIHIEPFPDEEPVAEEEPYTIKCICGFQGDDGNTIYCEICDSWQHIECFYPNNSEEATREEFAHACHECKPRALDIAHAISYQRQRLEAASAETLLNQKPKRPPSKSHAQSHKKKTKPTDLLLNGHASPAGDVPKHSTSAHDSRHPSHPPAKKPKSAHKSSHSVGGSHSKRSPSYSASRNGVQNGHPLSPATTPPDLPDGVEIHNYTSEFLSLCKEQNTVQTVQTNSFASLAVSNAISIWLRQPERMLKETGHTFADVFQTLPHNIDTIKHSPHLAVKKRILGHDTAVRWRYLATPAAIDKDVPLMELNGHIGFQNEYCVGPANRYDELSCPLPFVFFHPLLPLCIDTRREGSLARYVRRSCQPNAVLDTFLSGGSEYHFWLVSDRHIGKDEQITIPWDFRLPHKEKSRMLRLLGLGDDERTDDMNVSEEEYNSIARWVYQILSEYGGCACELANECAFARFHRTYGNRTHQIRNGPNSANNHSKKKASRKPKGHTMSPTSTGHATNSRAASEGRVDEFLENDKASTSSRSKPPSRDLTPTPHQGSFDTLGILTEPTDRDKRKVAMVEDSFRRLEQQPPRKKKRTSDGTIASDRHTPNHSKSKSKSSANHSVMNSDHPDLGNGVTGHHYIDAGTASRSKSGSPFSATSPRVATGNGNRNFLPRPTSTGPRPSYCDASVQTDPTEGEWYTQSPAPCKRRRVISLAKRLLSSRHHMRLTENTDGQQLSVQSGVSSTTQIDMPSADASQAKTAPEKSLLNEISTSDVPMIDAPRSPATSEPANAMVAPTQDAPGQDTPVKKSPDLHVQLPKVPSIADAMTLLATPSSISQSPLAALSTNGTPVTPSPIKKKMSLSDYTKSRKAAASRPSAGTPLKPLASSGNEPKSATSADDTGAGDSPTSNDKITNVHATITVLSAGPAPGSGLS